jgi:alpha-galactosidase
MKKTKRFLIAFRLLILLSSPFMIFSSPLQTGKTVDPEAWINKNFSKGRIPPFSFVYNGKHSDLFIKAWRYKKEKLAPVKGGSNRYRFTYLDKQTNLKIYCDLTAYSVFPAVEWTLNFSNGGSTNTPVIEQVAAINYGLDFQQKGPLNVHHALGSNAAMADFQPLLRTMETGDSMYMTPAGGRSSDKTAFPFFNIETPDRSGVVVAVGWTGKWYADLHRTNANSLRLKAGMERIKLYLEPGESIRTPEICLLFWQGEDRMTGHNEFRKFIMAHHTRLIDGKVPDLPLASLIDREAPFPFSENEASTEINSVAHIKRHEQFKIVPEAFWMDAGWYANKGGWSKVGDLRPNKEYFPNGLRPVTNTAHAAGSKFILWFEPERLVKGVPNTIYDKHPEWFTELPTSQNLLFDLGKKEAREWLTDYISDMITREGIDYYRQDFNFDPAPYWQKKDEELRQGISEIRHIEGLYAYWDSLLVRFPNLIIDNCASGGRRIDLETTSRSSPFWRTDYTYGEPLGSQSHTYGLNFWLPLSATGSYLLSPYHYRSAMASNTVIGWNINDKKNKVVDMQQMMKEFKQIRPYYYFSDYYPLTDKEGVLKDDVWLAYQMNRPDKQDGIVMAFRRPASKDSSVKVSLKGLLSTATYELVNQDTQEKVTHLGSDLQKGLTLSLKDPQTSLLLLYRKVK